MIIIARAIDILTPPDKPCQIKRKEKVGDRTLNIESATKGNTRRSILMVLYGSHQDPRSRVSIEINFSLRNCLFLSDINQVYIDK